jgi:selenocysteine lyase/cysteine desulfurase
VNDARRPLAELLGADLEVPVWGGGQRRYTNLDYAATTPPLRQVWARIEAVLPWYGSVHRGAGFKSVVSSRLLDEAQHRILTFAGGNPDRDALLLASNTTTAVNALARRLGLRPSDVVVTSEIEHSSNLLPWRKHATVLPCPTDPDGTLDLTHLSELLAEHAVSLIAVTAASNVTGALPDIHAVARLAHDHGARVFVDAAQLVAHRKLDRRPHDSAEHLDFVAFAGHKMYAPFGVGVVLGPRSAFEDGWPDSPGGGTLTLIDGPLLVWSQLPDRELGGTPNYLGVVSLAAACEALEAIGFDRIGAHEAALVRHARAVLGALEGLNMLRSFTTSGSDIALFPFAVTGYHHGLVAAILGAEWGIGVRSGHLCQYELVRRLLRVSSEKRAEIREEVLSGDRRRLYGVVRASCGLGTTTRDLDLLADALRVLIADGPRAQYAQTSDGRFSIPGWLTPFPAELLEQQPSPR